MLRLRPFLEKVGNEEDDPKRSIGESTKNQLLYSGLASYHHADLGLVRFYSIMRKEVCMYRLVLVSPDPWTRKLKKKIRILPLLEEWFRVDS